MKKSIAENAWMFVQSLSLVYCVQKYGIFASYVQGPSMYPTFKGRGDEVVLVDAFTPWAGRISKGDIVICSRPMASSSHEVVIKRVHAMEKEMVTLYPDAQHADVRLVEVPKGHIWLQGDNPIQSLDSRTYGPVPIALVKGRVLFQIWPSLKSIK
jgi:inner membrane protease subunit 1